MAERNRGVGIGRDFWHTLLGCFRGPGAWIFWLALPMYLALWIFGLYALYEMIMAEALLPALKWGVGAVLGIVLASLTEVWAWQEVRTRQILARQRQEKATGPGSEAPRV